MMITKECQGSALRGMLPLPLIDRLRDILCSHYLFRVWLIRRIPSSHKVDTAVHVSGKGTMDAVRTKFVPTFSRYCQFFSDHHFSSA